MIRIRTQCSSGRVTAGMLPQTSWHQIEIADDGTISTPDCPNAVSEAPKIAALVRLGRGCQSGWCGSFVALHEYGIPDIVATRDLGAWRDIYIRYESVKAIERRKDDVERERDKPHTELFRRARHAFRQCYVSGKAGPNGLVLHAPLDLNELFHGYIRDPRLELGQVVSFYNSDFWTVPLSPTWLADVSDLGIAVVGNQMVLGVNQQQPGFVYAIAKEGGAYVVREYYYNAVTKTLGLVAAEKTA